LKLFLESIFLNVNTSKESLDFYKNHAILLLMNAITVTLTVILSIIVLCNLRKIGSFIYGITIHPWTLLFSSSSTGNGAGMFGPLVGLFCIGLQFVALLGGTFLTLFIWKLSR
jgi:hypothetical protein